jgi:hypothetical protein
MARLLCYSFATDTKSRVKDEHLNEPDSLIQKVERFRDDRTYRIGFMYIPRHSASGGVRCHNEITGLEFSFSDVDAQKRPSRKYHRVFF